LFLTNVARAVWAVQQVLEGAKKRRLFPTRYGVTFFSVHDVWLYIAIMDAKVCPICRAHERTGEFHGDHLRAEFPYLEIIDENTIKAHAHMPRDDNCRCYFARKLEKEED